MLYGRPVILLVAVVARRLPLSVNILNSKEHLNNQPGFDLRSIALHLRPEGRSFPRALDKSDKEKEVEDESIKKVDFSTF